LTSVMFYIKPTVQKIGLRSYAGAADLKVLKRRGKTVSQIGRITGILKVVAQSRLQVAMEKAASVQPFFATMQGVFEPLTNQLKENSDSVNVSTIVIYSDRGLCGPTNNGINRMLAKESMSNQNVVLWGEKGVAGFEKSKHKSKVAFSFHPNTKTPLSFNQVSSFVQKISSTECGLYRIVFNRMRGPNASDIDELWIPSLAALDEEAAREVLAPYEIEAVSSDELLHNLHEFYLCSAINYAIFQNMAVELFQRRNSMQNASTNAKEVAHKIKLKYNKARQSMITTELGEIVSGAAAVDAMIQARK